MKTIGIRALRENPGILSKHAASGEYVLLTNRNDPMSLSIPFDDELIKEGVHVAMAIKFYEDGLVALAKAARIARMSVEAFLSQLAELDIDVVDQSEAELAEDLKNLEA